MVTDNNEQLVVEVPGECPFYKTPCIKDRCQLYTKVTQMNQFGRTRDVGSCTFLANLMVLNSLVQLLAGRQQRKTIQLPGDLKMQ